MLRNVNNKKEDLNLPQKKFLEEYAKTLDAEHSATFAGYKNSGARTQAKKMLLREKYLHELNLIIEEKARCYEITKGYIIKKYYEILTHATTLEGGTPQDAVLALRALDGLCKQFLNFEPVIKEEENSLGTMISGLNLKKV